MRQKYLVWIVGIFLFCSLPVLGQEVTPPYDDELLKVEGRLNRGDIYGALTDLEHITDKYPDATDVFYAKALLYGQIGDVVSATRNAKEAYRLKPTLFHANFLIELYRREKNQEELILLYQDLRQRFPKEGFIGRHLMVAYIGMKKYDEALDVYTKEVELGHQSDSLEVCKAEVYIAQSQYAEARTILLPLSNKSTYGPVYSRLIYTYEQENNIAQAVATAQEGINRSKDPYLYFDLADLYRLDVKKSKLMFEALTNAFNSQGVNFGDKYNAILGLLNSGSGYPFKDVNALAEILLEAYPRIEESLMLNADFALRSGNLALAKNLATRVLTDNKNNIGAWQVLMDANFRDDMPQEAIKHGEAGLQFNPDNATLMYFTGLAYLMTDDLNKSQKLLEGALDNSEESSEYQQSMIFGALGDLYHQLDKYAESDAAYEEAIRLDSTNVSAMNNLAYYLAVRKKDLDKANEYSRLSNELRPDVSNYQDTYAWVLFQQGNYQDALIWIEKAVKGSRNSAVVYEHYGDILSKIGKTKEAIKQWEKALTLVGDASDKKDNLKEKIKERRYVE